MVHFVNQFIGGKMLEAVPSCSLFLHRPRRFFGWKRNNFFLFQQSHDSLRDGLGFRDERYNESDGEAVGDGETGLVEEADPLVPEQPHGEDGRDELRIG